MTEPGGWRAELRALFGESFECDWQEHLRQLNARYGLEGRHRLATEVVGCPPTWFNGDVTAIAPGRWVMVVSPEPVAGARGALRGLQHPRRTVATQTAGLGC